LVGLSADIISCVEFNSNGQLLATGDKGGRVVIFQRDGKVKILKIKENVTLITFACCLFFMKKMHV
jgi:hypothetical protein